MSGVPGPVGRFAILFFTPLYLMLLSVILSTVSHRELYIAALAVFAGAAAMMAIIAILSSRFAKSADGESRYSITTLMLLTVAFSIYMAYISQFMIAGQPQALDLKEVARILFYCSFFFIMTTILLVRFTDAVIAVAIWGQSMNRRNIEKRKSQDRSL